MISDHLNTKQNYNQRYKIIKLIKNGGQAPTYLVYDLFHHKYKVIKEIKMFPQFRIGLIDQIKILKLLNHNNIVRISECHLDCQYKKNIYLQLIMEYVEGGQLRNEIKSLTDEQIYKIYTQIKSALQYIHSFKIIHRDLTMGNILLDKNKNVKLIDFGISTLLEDKTHDNANGARTDYYQSPEFRDKNMARIQLDLWQLGIIMIQLLTHTQIEELIKTQNEKGQIYNYHPAANINFLDQIFKRFQIKKQFQLILRSLLERDYQNRKFPENIQMKFENVIKGTQILKINLKKLTDSQLILQIKPYFRDLIQLNCQNNLISDESSKTIIQLIKLKELKASGNNLTDVFIENINAMLIRLTRLNLSFTNITDLGLSIIIKFGENLKSLDISYTKVTSQGIPNLSSHKKLQQILIWSGNCYPKKYYAHINLHNSNKNKYWNNYIDINQQCIKHLLKMKLKSLTINLNNKSADEMISGMKKDARCMEVVGKISNQNIDRIMDMNQLETIYLKEVNDYEIRGFCSKKLVSVELINCNIELGLIRSSLSKCEKLRTLNLSDNNIGDQEAKVIAVNLTKLTSLYLSLNNIKDDGANAIAQALKNLTILDLGNNHIKDQGAISIARELKNLTDLYLSFNNIGKVGSSAIADNLKRIRILDLSYNNVGQQGAISIAQRLTNLTNLYLPYNNIGLNGTVAIAQYLKNLEILDLSYNNVGQQGAVAIANKLSGLTELDLQKANIGENGVTAIVKNLKNLTILNLSLNEYENQEINTILKQFNLKTSFL